MSGIDFKGSNPSQMGGPIGQMLKKVIGGGGKPEDGAVAGEQPKAGEGMKKGGKVSSASSRGDGCCVKGKTKGRMV